MAKFYIGQRVRVVRIELAENLHLLGKEGVVTEVETDSYGLVGYGLNICPITRCLSRSGWEFWALCDDQLEPLCKDDDQVGSWDALEELGLDVDAVKEAVRA